MTLAELNDRRLLRRRLTNLAITCVVVLAIFALGSCGPSDSEIESSVTRETTTTVRVRIAALDGPVIFPTTVPTTTVVPATTVPAPTVPPPSEPPPAPAPSEVVMSPSGSVWDRLAECESGGNWHINTGNGYYGGLQFSLRSWQWVGGTGYPHEHSRETQIHFGEKLRQLQGWGAWPACSKKLGLR